MESISAANKIRCVTYKDEFSSMKSSINDSMSNDSPSLKIYTR